MADTQLTISVPTELSNLGTVVQGLVSDLTAGKSWMGVVSGVLPVLFSEGAKWDELKEEIKDPQVYLLGAVIIGSIAAKYFADKAADAALPVQPVV